LQQLAGRVLLGSAGPRGSVALACRHPWGSGAGNPRAQKQQWARHLALDRHAAERVPGAACAWEWQAFLYISLVQRHEARREPSVKHADEWHFCMHCQPKARR